MYYHYGSGLPRYFHLAGTPLKCKALRVQAGARMGRRPTWTLRAPSFFCGGKLKRSSPLG
jgi:hypothetical protein